MGMMVFKYGLRGPTMNEELVRQQMRAAHDYRNALVEIERARRAAVRSVMTADGAVGEAERALGEAEAALQSALAAVADARKKTRSRSETGAMKEAVKLARARKSEAVRAFAAARKAHMDGAAKHELEQIKAREGELQRGARNMSGAFWGTYLLIEAAHQQVRAMPLYDEGAPNDPHFVRWQGEGRVGIQLQRPFPVDDVFGAGRWLRIAPVDERAWNSESRGERRRLARTKLMMRVESDGQDPVWAEWPMVMHRPLPKGGRIRWVAVSMRRVGPREEWSVEITVETPDATQPTCGTGAVAVNLGWRLTPDGLRVATWVAEDGTTDHVMVPTGQLRYVERNIGGGKREMRAVPSLLDAFAKVDDLRGVRDGRFNIARDALADALETLVDVPSWLREKTSHLRQWRSPARLAVLATRWREQRFAGDEDAFLALEAWRIQDRHLWTWESDQRDRVLRWRREIYRVAAADLARQYGTVVVEKTNMAKLARRPSVERQSCDNPTARHSRMTAAAGKARMIFAQAFASRGGRVVKVEPKDITRECHVCHHTHEDPIPADHIEHVCAKCGEKWDRDVNAAKNLLERWRAAENAGGARSVENVNDSGAKQVSKRHAARSAKRRSVGESGGARKQLPSVA